MEVLCKLTYLIVDIISVENACIPQQVAIFLYSSVSIITVFVIVIGKKCDFENMFRVPKSPGKTVKLKTERK